MKSSIINQLRNSLKNVFSNSNYNLLSYSRQDITNLMKNYRLFKHGKLDNLHKINNLDYELKNKDILLKSNENILKIYKNLDDFIDILKNMNDAHFLNEVNFPNKDTTEEIDYLEIFNEKELFENSILNLNKKECSFTISLGLFYLNPIKNTVNLDLHDHPGMYVFSKCLVGELNILNINTIDGLNQEILGSNQNNLNSNNNVSLKTNYNFNRHKNKHSLSRNLLKNGEYSELFPDYNNMHNISANEKSILLDFFIPHYDNYNECSYYNIINEEDEDNIIIKKI